MQKEFYVVCKLTLLEANYGNSVEKEVQLVFEDLGLRICKRSNISKMLRRIKKSFQSQKEHNKHPKQSSNLWYRVLVNVLELLATVVTICRDITTFNYNISVFNSWELMPTLRFPRCFASAAVCKQNLYVLGGAWLDSELEESNFSSVYDMDIYNPVSKLWEGVTALSIGRHDAGIAVLGR